MSDAPPRPLAEFASEPLSEATAKPMAPSAAMQAPWDTRAEASPGWEGTATQAGLGPGEPAQGAVSDEPTARGATVPMPMTKRPANRDANPADAPSTVPPGPSPKSPLSYLTGSLTSALMAWVCLLFSQRVVLYFSLHPPHYSARFAQSIATAIKTLIVGMGFLSTFSCAFVALGLFLVFIRSLSRAEAPGAS